MIAPSTIVGGRYRVVRSIGGGGMISADDFAQIFGIEPPRQRRRVHQITEHHGQLATLTIGEFMADQRLLGLGNRGSDQRRATVTTELRVERILGGTLRTTKVECGATRCAKLFARWIVGAAT